MIALRYFIMCVRFTPLRRGVSLISRGNLETGWGAIPMTIGGSAALILSGAIQPRSRRMWILQAVGVIRMIAGVLGPGSRVLPGRFTGASSCAVSPAGGGAGTGRGLMNWAGFRPSRRRKKRYG